VGVFQWCQRAGQGARRALRTGGGGGARIEHIAANADSVDRIAAYVHNSRAPADPLAPPALTILGLPPSVSRL
jgi:microcystin degradation protein MlrC